MTKQQIELLGILRDFGPLTRQAVAGIIDAWAYEDEVAGSWELSAVGKRLHVLERLGWAESVWICHLQNKYIIREEIGYCPRYRKLWAITYTGYARLREKGGK